MDETTFRPRIEIFCFKSFMILVLLLIGQFGCSGNRKNDVDAKTKSIIRAARKGDLNAVKRMVDADKSVLHLTDSNGNTAAIVAILNDQFETAIFLIEAGFPNTQQTTSNLVMACCSRFTESSQKILNFVLENEDDSNIGDASEGWRTFALHRAVNNGQMEKVKTLVRFGADLKSKNNNGLTPIQIAKQRVADRKNPNYSPHGTLDDPTERQREIEKWEKMVRLLSSLTINKSKKNAKH